MSDRRLLFAPEAVGLVHVTLEAGEGGEGGGRREFQVLCPSQPLYLPISAKGSCPGLEALHDLKHA
jgi:hypothetical protein